MAGFVRLAQTAGLDDAGIKVGVFQLRVFCDSMNKEQNSQGLLGERSEE